MPLLKRLNFRTEASDIAKLFGCSRDTIRVGIKELGQEDELADT
jgi:DNA-binding GntR family transcriptional regulator